MPEVIDAPAVATTTEIVNPVIPAGMDLSKSIFRDEMEKAEKTAAKEEKTATEPPAQPNTGLSVPADLLGEPPAAKVPDAIAEIDAMVLPKNAKPEQVASFSKLKDAAKRSIEEAHKRVAELETKTSDGTTKAEIESAQTRAQAAEARALELEERLNRTAFEKSDTFKSQFTDRETAAIEGAKSYLEGTEISPGVIDMALHAQGAKRVQILKNAGIDSETIALISPNLTNYDNLQRDKTRELDGWKAKADAMQQQETAQVEKTKAQKVAEEDRAWTGALTLAQSSLLPLRKSEGNDAWNAQVDAVAQRAKEKFNGIGASVQQMAEIMLKGEAYDILDGIVKDLVNDLNASRAENTKLKSARPGGSDLAGKAAKTPAKVDPVQRAKDTFNAHLAAASGAQ